MQVTAIYAGVDEYAQKLDYVFNIFSNTSNELGIKIEKINITKFNIDNFSGKRITIIENIFNNIKNSSAVIFACTSKLLAPCGAMQSFLEHFDQVIYPNILQDKPCYTIITSFDGSEFNAGNYISTVVNILGGNSIGNMLIGTQYLDGIEASLEITQMIERYAEDFYRLVKQNRKLFQSKPFNNISQNIEPTQNQAQEQYGNNSLYQEGINRREIDLESLQNQIKKDSSSVKNLNGQQVASLYQKEIDNQSLNSYFSNQNLNINNKNTAYTNTNNYTSTESSYTSQLQNFNSYQDDDISEITKLLTNQYKVQNKQNSLDTFNINTFQNEKMLNGGTCKQRTQSLYHYFQPQIAKDMNITIQINISGEENFNGFFEIKNGECNYIEGISPAPEVSIMADSRVWEDVLKSKYTLQKAFMLGKIKVKGNFVIISKFEQIFKFV